ncbi:hypothetical protein P12x_004362 [Tundrisphaera lichenicola]|uniref:hypothetical protein n=1 Tax=Tundrisphaera lichenicola TaxID=2029860 RepID=UPI003EBBEF4E
MNPTKSRPAGRIIHQGLSVLTGTMLVGLTFGWSRTLPDQRPFEIIGDPTFQCGTMPRGSFGRHRWEFHNLGTTSIRLRTRFTSGRSGFSLWQGISHRIEPGGRIDLFLTWPVPGPPGQPFANYVLLRTDVFSEPEIRLRVVGSSDQIDDRD